MTVELAGTFCKAEIPESEIGIVATEAPELELDESDAVAIVEKEPLSIWYWISALVAPVLDLR